MSIKTESHLSDSSYIDIHNTDKLSKLNPHTKLKYCSKGKMFYTYSNKPKGIIGRINSFISWISSAKNAAKVRETHDQLAESIFLHYGGEHAKKLFLENSSSRIFWGSDISVQQWIITKKAYEQTQIDLNIDGDIPKEKKEKFTKVLKINQEIEGLENSYTSGVHLGYRSWLLAGGSSLVDKKKFKFIVPNYQSHSSSLIDISRDLRETDLKKR